MRKIPIAWEGGENMTREKEQLRQQLELLAELSKTADERDVPCITSAMCEIYDRLEGNRLRIPFGFTVFLLVLSNLLVSILVLIP